MNNYESKQPITPRDFEIEINSNSNFYIKLNEKRSIDYINSEFCNVSGYNDYELIDEQFVGLWHPEMPYVLHEILFESLNRREKLNIIVKMLAKDGRYFWVFATLDGKLNDYGEIIGYYIHCKPVSKYAVQQLVPLYHILKKIEEKSNNTHVSRRYIIGFLEEQKTNLNNYITNLCKTYPIVDQMLPYDNAQKGHYYQPNQQQHPLYGSPAPYNPNVNQEVKPEVKKSLFQRIFGSKQ